MPSCPLATAWVDRRRALVRTRGPLAWLAAAKARACEETTPSEDRSIELGMDGLPARGRRSRHLRSGCGMHGFSNGSSGDPAGRVLNACMHGA